MQSSNKDREIAWCFEGVLGAREQKCFLVFALAPPPPCVIAASAIVEGEFSGFRANGKEESGYPLRRGRADMTGCFDPLFDRL